MKFQGLTNKIVLENNLVVKYTQPISKLYLDKINEYNVLFEFKRSNQEIMIKAKEFYFEEDCLVSKFEILKDYKTLDEEKITNNILDLVVLAIKQFHSIDIQRKIKKFDYKNYLDLFFNNINNFLFDLNQEYNEILQKIDFTKKLKQVYSHNDLVPGNILIRNNSIKLIDYDFVMLNNIYFDIASFITETLNNNNNLIDEFIAKCIFQNIISIDEIDNLKIIIKYQDLLWTLWANFMFENTNQNIYKEICIEKYKRLKSRK